MIGIFDKGGLYGKTQGNKPLKVHALIDINYIFYSPNKHFFSMSVKPGNFFQAHKRKLIIVGVGILIGLSNLTLLFFVLS